MSIFDSYPTPEGQQIELRLWPEYDENGYYQDNDDGVPSLHVCRYLVPVCIARLLNRIGFNCGIRLSTGGLPGWALGTKYGRRWLLYTLFVIVIIFLAWVAFSRGRHTKAILASPCYVCNPQVDSTILNNDEWSHTNASETNRALRMYSRYAHGSNCALDDSWIRALEVDLTRSQALSVMRQFAKEEEEEEQQQQQQQKMNKTKCLKHKPNCDYFPWQRFDKWSSTQNLFALPEEKTSNQKNNPTNVPFADWRNTLPRVYIVGCRGAGTTSLQHYLNGHPEIAIRYQPSAFGSSSPSLYNNRRSSPYSSKKVNRVIKGKKDTTPWDDHFFASIPDWSADELRSWLKRGWGSPSLKDHRGQGRVRVEVGPDYLWLSSTGAAASIRRARLPEPDSTPKFVLLVDDPVKIVRESYERAVDAGVETETSFGKIVAKELPRLAQCLWWDQASFAEQQERVVSGLCGQIGSPGRIGGPYLWRGLTSLYLSHWIRTTTPAERTKWYFIRSKDLLQQPNRTLNRLVVNFLELQPFDFEPFTRQVWHPSTEVVKDLAPGAPWKQSWNSYVPRVDMISWARKKTKDKLLDAASSAARRFIPGLDSSLKTINRLKQLHCKLSNIYSEDKPLTYGAQDCVRGVSTSNNNNNNNNNNKE